MLGHIDFETSAAVYQSALRHVPEDLYLRPHRCENLKSHAMHITEEKIDGLQGK
jgi:hypothetical protein